MNECLSGRKVALIYYGSVALTFTVQHPPSAIIILTPSAFTDEQKAFIGPGWKVVGEVKKVGIFNQK